MRIPRIFHQIWVGPDPLPDEYARFQQTWLEHHPGWELRFWTEDNLPGDLRRPEALERLRAPAERANLLRLDLLWAQGGVYVDTDFECRRSIEPLLGDAGFVISLAKPDRVNNALMGSVPGHPLVGEALDRIQPREFFGHDKAATGTRFLDTIVLGRDDVTLIEPELLYPQTPEAKSVAYAEHHMARSWKDPELLRLDVERAERKLERAQKATRKWQARYAESQTELDRLRGSTGAEAEKYPYLQSFCLFIGYPRSGHSLVGSVLDAHPDAAIAHELNVLRLVRNKTTREELFERLLENTARHADRTRKASGYKYAVEGQWQGALRTLRVIGDKTGSKSTRQAGRHPLVLPELQEIVRLPLKMIHVTRNPYDMVARIALMTKDGVQERSVPKSTAFVRRLASTNQRIIETGDYEVLTVRQESLVHEPRENLRAICEFLDLTAEDDYLEACAALVFDSPHHTRELVAWSDEEKAAVERLVERYAFFSGYSWESDD